MLQKPTIEQLKQLTMSPWMDETYFETVIENDPALQFGALFCRWMIGPWAAFLIDIEEDLQQLGDLTLSEQPIAKDPLSQANERIRQLEEMVATMK
jgi:hypothetical protein